MKFFNKALSILFWPILIIIYLSWDEMYEYYLQVTIDPGLTEYSSRDQLSFCEEKATEDEEPKQLIGRIRQQFNDPVKTDHLLTTWRKQQDSNEKLNQYKKFIVKWQPGTTDEELKRYLKEDLNKYRKMGFKSLSKKEDHYAYQALVTRLSNPDIDIEAIEKEYHQMYESHSKPINKKRNKYLQKLACITADDSFTKRQHNKYTKSNKDLAKPLLAEFTERFAKLYFNQTLSILETGYNSAEDEPIYQLLVKPKQGKKAIVECKLKVSSYSLSVVGVGYVSSCSIQKTRFKFSSKYSKGALVSFHQDYRVWDEVTKNVISKIRNN